MRGRPFFNHHVFERGCLAADSADYGVFIKRGGKTDELYSDDK